MQHADASNSSVSSSEPDFEILGETYLDPLLAQRNFFWIGLYERLQSKAIRRVFRGPLPPCHEFEFGVGNVGMVAEKGIRKVVPDVSSDAQYSQCFIETQSEVIEPIRFENEVVGVIDVEESKKNGFSESDQKLVRELSEQVAPVFAWKNASWPLRLHCLQRLSELKRRYKDFDWIGIYRYQSGADDLILSCYFGEPTEHVRIPRSKGICGAAVRENRTLNIENVHADPRFIACSAETQSELVVPIRNSQGEAIAEIDIDSNQLASFTAEKVASVEALAEELGRLLEREPSATQHTSH